MAWRCMEMVAGGVKISSKVPPHGLLRSRTALCGRFPLMFTPHAGLSGVS